MIKLLLIFFTLINLYALSDTQKLQNSQLLQYAEDGNFSMVKKYIESGADIETKYSGSHPILKAAFNGHTKILKYLLSKGADRNVLSNTGRNILVYAVQNKDLELTKYLIANGVSIVRFQRDTLDLLFTAMRHGDIDMLEYLLPMFEPLSSSYYYTSDTAISHRVKSSLLFLAIQHDEIEVARFLISKGSDINRANSQDETPLLCSMRRKHYKFAKELMADGADTSVVDIAGNSTLSYAIKAHQTDIALEVLQNPNFDIYQLLQASVFQSNPDIYEYYIWQSKAEWEDYTFLHMAARHSEPRVLQALLDLGLDIDTLTIGETLRLDAVGLSAWFADKKTLKLLLDNGANPYRVYINKRAEGNYGLYYMGGLSGKYTLLSLSLNAEHKDSKLIEYLLNLKDASLYAQLDSQYFYFNILLLSEQAKEGSIYSKTLKQLNEWNYPNRSLILKSYNSMKKKGTKK